MRDYEDRWRTFLSDRQNMTLSEYNQGKVPLRTGVAYYEPAGIVNPVVFSTPTAASGPVIVNTIEEWIPAAEWIDKGPGPEMVATQYQQDMGERPRYEDDFPIYRWESNIKGVDTWVKINDAAGDDTLIGDHSSLTNQSRMVVTRNNSERHSDEHLLKMLGAHPKR